VFVVRLTDGSDKPVATAGNGFDEPGIVGVVTEGLSQFRDCSAEALTKLNESIFRPEVLLDGLAADDLSGIFKKQKKKLKGLILQLDSMSVPEEFSRFDEDLEDPEAIDSFAISRASHELDRRKPIMVLRLCIPPITGT
jgi:hypothetical protein